MINPPLFTLAHQDSTTRARTGVINTDHGKIHTPMFMPVGTQATVKSLDQTDLKNIKAEIILGNTYHLHLRPGEDLIAEQGGLHRFMNWDRPILTDSGGFQVFSLGRSKEQGTRNKPSEPDETEQDKVACSKQGRLVAIDEDGVTFTSHIDGSEHRFTPESAIDIQHKLGADIIMAFDECTPDDAAYDYTKAAMERTHRWAERSLAAHQKSPLRGGLMGGVGYRQWLFGIVQGSNHRELREASARFISGLDFDGVAIGGESIGYNMSATADILDWVYPLIPADKPRYAMGVGLNPTDLLVAVEHGIDMFDCVAPTRLARHGMFYISPSPAGGEIRRGGSKHRLNIKNAQFKKDLGPIDPSCRCHTCVGYSRSYLYHLFATDELTGLRLASIHNLHFLLNLMKETREAIQEDRFLGLKKEWVS